MASTYLFSFMLLLSHNLLNGAPATVQGHSIDTVERESDGAYRSRDSDHYGDAGHNVDFDHEAILGSVKEAEEFDKLSEDEAKRRLGLLLPKMDLNDDQHVDREELHKWILNSFITLSREETQERLADADDNQDGAVSWSEYMRDAYGVTGDNEVDSDELGDTGMMVREEKEMWQAADTDGDGKLNGDEFQVFTNPEEHASMHPHLINQTMREKDANHDGKIDFNEYLGDRAQHQDKEWLLVEKEKFEEELDLNHDGILDAKEIKAWVIPDNNEIAEEEVEHLFASADDDHDNLLSFAEILAHHDVFVGSEATDYGGDLMGEHFDDEL